MIVIRTINKFLSKIRIRLKDTSKSSFSDSFDMLLSKNTNTNSALIREFAGNDNNWSANGFMLLCSLLNTTIETRGFNELPIYDINPLFLYYILP